MKGVILYGPPASGKTSVAEALERLDDRYVAFRRLKAGPGRTYGYRMTTVEAIDALDAQGEIVWRNYRYGATYAIDCNELITLLARSIPILQVGQPEAAAALRGVLSGVRWTVVALSCSREVAIRRLRARRDVDVVQRMAAWDATVHLRGADIWLDTGANIQERVAEEVDAIVRP